MTLWNVLSRFPSEWELLWRDWCNKLSFKHGLVLWLRAEFSNHISDLHSGARAYRLLLCPLVRALNSHWHFLVIPKDKSFTFSWKNGRENVISCATDLHRRQALICPIMMANCSFSSRNSSIRCSRVKRQVYRNGKRPKTLRFLKIHLWYNKKKTRGEMKCLWFQYSNVINVL